MSGKQVYFGLAGIGLAILFCWILFLRGYGEVSQPTYDFALALYGACLAKSEARIDKIESALDSVPEIQTTQVDLQRGQVVVGGPVDADTVRTRIRSAGFQVTGEASSEMDP